MSRVTQAKWRQWAIELTLYKREVLQARGPQRSADLLHDLEAAGWKVLPTNGRMDAIHATCNRLAKEGPGSKIRRINTRPIRWELTDLGKNVVRDFLLDNPNITPEKSQEEGAYA